jgi:glycosyltransferase involved in cell wall biosynthesis
MMTYRYRSFHFLFLLKDKFPPFRPDLENLFGKEFLERGHKIDWIMQADDQCRCSGKSVWRNCDVWIARTDSGDKRINRLKKNILSFINDTRVFSCAFRRHYDFIQVKDTFLSALLGLIAAKFNRVRFFYWLSFPFPEAYFIAAKSNKSKYRIYYLLRGLVSKFILYRIISRFADHIFVQSDEMKLSMARAGIPADKMTPVPMGIDMRLVTQLESTDLASDSQPNIVYLGSLNRDRQLDFLLNAFQRVVRVVPNIKLYIVGGAEDPDDILFLKSEAERLQIGDKVIFTRFLPQNIAFEYIRRATVCVSPIPPGPMYDVSTPTKIVEYMAFQRPVVANDLPDQKKILAASGGGICTGYDVESFANAIIYILQHPDEATKMGKNGHKFVQKERSYESIANLLESRYLHLCGKANC